MMKWSLLLAQVYCVEDANNMRAALKTHTEGENRVAQLKTEVRLQ